MSFLMPSSGHEHAAGVINSRPRSPAREEDEVPGVHRAQEMPLLKRIVHVKMKDVRALDADLGRVGGLGKVIHGNLDKMTFAVQFPRP
jgi:hypothetical protein